MSAATEGVHMVKVTVFSGDTQDLEHVEGRTVRQCLEACRAPLSDGAAVSLNGAPATLDTVVPDGGVVIYAPQKIANG